MPIDPNAWPEVRRSYCETSEPIAAICGRFDITPAELKARRLKEGWPARAPAVQRSGTGAKPKSKPAPVKLASPRSSKPKAKRRADKPSSANRGAMIRRLYNAIDLKLTQMEQLMTDDTETSSADHEREARALSTLIQTFERMLEFDPAARPAHASSAAKSDRANGEPAARASGIAATSADAERLRRDITERVERLMDKRNAPRTPG